MMPVYFTNDIVVFFIVPLYFSKIIKYNSLRHHFPLFDKNTTNVSIAAGVIPGSLEALAKLGGVAAVNRSATSVDIP